MAAIKDQAIVLRRLDYSETSQVLAFLTREHGPRRLIAKGIKRGTKKRFATGIDLLERGHVLFTARGQGEHSLGVLTEWVQVDAYLGLRQGLHPWYAAQYVAEITAAMTEEADPHPELFDDLVSCLEALAAASGVLPVVAGYQRSLLTAAGLWPDLSRCVLCDRPAPTGRAAYYSVGQGGLVCRRCEPDAAGRLLLDVATLAALRAGEFDAHTARKAFDTLNTTIVHAMGRPTAAARFL